MIPNVVHFVYINERPWKLHHYLSVKSAFRLNPEKVNIWLDKEPEGKWWELTKPLVELHFVDPPTEIFGTPIKGQNIGSIGNLQQDLLGYKMARVFGNEKIAYLSNTYRDSDFIFECARGEK